jgi:hypothetical protein
VRALGHEAQLGGSTNAGWGKTSPIASRKRLG